MLVWRGPTLEYITLGWNVVGTLVSILAAVAAGSVALAGSGLSSLIEIGAPSARHPHHLQFKAQHTVARTG